MSAGGDTPLERELAALAAPWPPTPDLAARWAAEAAHIAGSPAQPRRRAPVGAWLRPALATLLAVAFACAAITPVRAAIGDLLGIAGGERIERVATVPRGAAAIDLGEPVTLAQARAAAGFPVRVPRLLGAPDEVRVGGDAGPRSVTLVYGADTVLTEIGDADVAFAVKELGPGVGFRYVRSLGAFWIARGPRALVLMRDGRRLVRRSALPGSGVLLWNRYAGSAAGTPIAYRLETRRPFAEALAIARSVGGAQ